MLPLMARGLTWVGLASRVYFQTFHQCSRYMTALFTPLTVLCPCTPACHLPDAMSYKALKIVCHLLV